MNLSSFGRRIIQLADAATFYSITNLFSTANTWTAIQTFSANPSLTGGAISFPATQVPSAGANDLDDYEEGSWTPTINFNGGTTGITYGTRAAKYVKIGQLVTAQFDVALTAKGSSTGVAQVGSLPFTSLNDGVIGAAYINFYSSFTGLTGSVSAYVRLGDTNIQLLQDSATQTSNLTDTVFTNTTRVVGTAIYRAT